MRKPVDTTAGRSHELKVWPEFFASLADGSKPFEVRFDDRGFRVGERLWLNEWIPHEGGGGEYTGGQLCKVITYILAGPMFGIERGYVVLGLADLPPDDFCKALAEDDAQEIDRLQSALTKRTAERDETARAYTAALRRIAELEYKLAVRSVS